MEWLRRNELKWQLLVAALLAMISLLHMDAASPQGIPSYDAGVFNYVGMVIQHGGMPYVDVFDHKGPLIYLINALAVEFGSWRMVAVFETVSLFAAFFFMFRIARLRANFFSSLLIVAFCTWWLNRSMLEGGNFTEEYALPWIAWAALLFLQFIQTGKIRRRGFFLIGFSLSMVVALRPNMIAVWAVGIPVSSWLLWHQHRLRQGWGWALGGFAAGLAPFLVWLAACGAIKACWETYIVFNLHYTHHFLEIVKQFFPDQAEKIGRYQAFTFFVKQVAWLPFMLCLFAMVWRKWWHDRAVWAALAMLFFSLLTVCMSGGPFWHYAMALLPVMVYPLAVFCEALEQVRFRDVPMCRYVLALGSVALAVFLMVSGVRDYTVRWHTLPDPGRVHMLEAASYIQSHTTTEDRILVFGGQTALHPLSGRLSSSKYPYQFPVIFIDSALRGDFEENIEKTLPKMIVIRKDLPSWYTPWREFMQAHTYELAPDFTETDDLMIYVLAE